MSTQVQNTRLLRDAALVVTKVLPGTSSNNTTDAIDIGSGPYSPEEITVEIAYPAMPLHVTSGNSVDITLYHGDTTSLATTATALSLTIKASVIGVASTGSVATVVRFKLPRGIKRYIGFYQACGGTDDLSSYTMTYTLLV